ncbi:MAG: HAMP domain-containing histidine kinase, partial [Actinobacteria bacterium]|nr:HAMP domain-containing histidine kinase [Actinomycetota bacterium]
MSAGLRAPASIRHATIRLTILNSAVLLSVIAVFAIAVNVYVSTRFDIEISDKTEKVLEHAISTLRMALLLGCAVLVILVPPISYLLARLALRPVRTNLEAQQRFVDDASHELRTPIAIAQGELELALMQQRSGDEYREAIGSALGAVEDLGALSAQLLVLARSERIVPGAPGTERIGLHELGERALLACPAELRSRIELRIASSGPRGLDRAAEVWGQPELLVRALVNLLENAAKFSPAASRIELLLEPGGGPSGGTVRLSVTDHGAGMSADDARH